MVVNGCPLVKVKVPKKRVNLRKLKFFVLIFFNFSKPNKKKKVKIIIKFR